MIYVSMQNANGEYHSGPITRQNKEIFAADSYVPARRLVFQRHVSRSMNILYSRTCSTDGVDVSPSRYSKFSTEGETLSGKLKGMAK
jgi:hypothetical protein